MKVRKKITFILFLLSITLLLTGCWSKRELNELAIGVALGIDRVDDQYEVTVQLVDPSELSIKQSSSRTAVVTYTTQGKTIFEAIRKMTLISSRAIYLSHLQMMVIGEGMATDGIKPTLDLLARDHEVRNNFYIVVSSKSTAREVLNILTPLEKIPANKLFSSLEVSQKKIGITSKMRLDQLINHLSSEIKSAALSTVEIIGDQQIGNEQTNMEIVNTPALLKYSGLSIFKEDKLVGILNEEESKSYNYLRDEIESTIESVSCPKNDGNVATEVINSKTEIKVKLINDIPEFDVNINVEQNIGEVECQIDLTDSNTLKQINEKESKQIEKRIKSLIEKLQNKYQVDVVGFGETMYRSHPKEWEKIKGQWEEEFFPKAKINVKVKIKTKGFGTLRNSPLYETKE
ncbi:Ger(x)C family spore germination protein [Viridibacillus sp. FSL R5-0888]|uniref:Ger(x)C family spore germination protein n=1 Tax=Viridibacillus sp. FSL R5-0888 TaxID=2921663 RepID=UPI0030F9322D